MRCAECGSEMRLTTEPITERYKGVTIAVEGVEHYICDACGEYELGPAAADELARQLVVSYAQACDLLTPQQIRDARKRLGMTQSQFEAVLGVSSPTASRWETGAMSPSKTVCRLIRLLLENPQLAQENRTEEHDVSEAAKGDSHRLRPGWKVIMGGASRGGSGNYRTNRAVGPNAGRYHLAKEG